MLELVIVRHGESVRNHASELAHHGDTTLLEYQLRFEREESAWDLTQRGIDQAKTTGTWIKQNIRKAFDLQVVSPFKRTLQTAACLNLEAQASRIDDRIREREWGDYLAPGLPRYSVTQYLEDLSHCNEVHWKGPFPGAESVEDLIPRCQAFFWDLIRDRKAGHVLLVTHGGTMKALQFAIEHLDIGHADLLAERHLSNCSVLQYHLERFARDDTHWQGSVRFASPVLPDEPVSEWQPIAGLSIASS